MKSLILAAALYLACLPAMAEDTWLPEFDPHQSLYVKEQLKPRLSLLPNFEQLIDQKARRHGLQVYVILTEAGDELGSTPREYWASNTLNSPRLWYDWQHKQGFSTYKSLVLLYVRDKNSDAGSTAVRVGSFLNNVGVNPQTLSSPTGPVLPTIKKYMRTDTETGVLTILDNINSIAAGTYQQVSHQTTTHNQSSEGIVMLVLLIVAGFVGISMWVASTAPPGKKSWWNGCSSSCNTWGNSCSTGSSCGGGSSCGSSCGGGGGD